MQYVTLHKFTGPDSAQSTVNNFGKLHMFCNNRKTQSIPFSYFVGALSHELSG